jgi:histone H3/H4
MPSRLAEAKQKKKRAGKSRLRPSTQSKRRQKYYKTGEGSVGLLVRRPRVVRFIRKIRETQNERIAKITGSGTSTSKKNVISRGCVDVMTGALDARANQLMDQAFQFAKHRKKKGGLKIRRADLELARSNIAKIKRQ